jgi:hypothetical protein
MPFITRKEYNYKSFFILLLRIVFSGSKMKYLLSLNKVNEYIDENIRFPVVFREKCMYWDFSFHFHKRAFFYPLCY